MKPKLNQCPKCGGDNIIATPNCFYWVCCWCTHLWPRQQLYELQAEQMYQEIFKPDLPARFQVAKTQEITDWLQGQKLTGHESISELMQRWFWDANRSVGCLPCDFA